MKLPNKNSQQGFAPVMVLVVVLGLLAFFTVANLGNFKNNFLASLYPKPSSQAAPTTNTTYSVVINQQSPQFGGSINFTAVYSKEATRSITTVQHENPDISMDCYQNGVHVYSQIYVFPSETNNKDGTLTGISNFGVLSSNGGNGISWPGGAATCNATLYYFGKDRQIHYLAQQRDIYVAP